jgi:desampylase
MWAMSLRISRQHIEQLLRYAELALPSECCGLLFGDDKHIAAVTWTQNVSKMPPTHFEIDPADLIAAERNSRGAKIGLIGYFHSHPNGHCRPSQIDAEMAVKDGRYWLIIANHGVSAWRAVQNGALHQTFDPVELDSTD